MSKEASESDLGGRLSRLWAPLGLLGLFGVGYLLRSGAALRSARPGEKAAEWKIEREAGLAPARLWEDPLDAVYRRELRDPRSRAASGASPPAEVTLAGLIAEGKPVLLMPVLLPGGPHPEDGETRRRTRYAVLLALCASGYSPAHGDAIGIIGKLAHRRFGVEAFKGPASGFGDSTAPYQAVVVAWVDETRLASPVLLDLVGILEEVLKNMDPNSKGSGEKFVVRGIGPTDSMGLASIRGYWQALTVLLERKPEDFLEPLRKLVLYSPWATIPDEYASEGTPKPASSPSVELYRTIGEDDGLVRALLHELGLRRPVVGRGSESIALVHEWDTNYGRALANLFERAVEAEQGLDEKGEREGETGEKEKRKGSACVRVPYLRGLDGRIPGKERSEAEPSDRGSEETPLDGGPAWEAARGNSQFDYARRLASRLKEEERSRESDVRAIGILGTDVYDKLLLLRALRTEFPRASFFTTDLDARLLDPGESDYTRNLIVATHFGLTPDPDPAIQTTRQVLPAFRDGYQTSVYRTCRKIAEGKEEWPPLPKPKVFEVGSGSFVQLKLGRYPKGIPPRAQVDTKPPEADLWVEADEAGRLLESAGMERLVWLSLTGAATVLILSLHGATRRAVSRARRILLGPRRRWVLLGAIPLALLALVILYDKGRPDGEPWGLLDGVSIWPSEILRALAATLGILFVANYSRSLKKNARRIEGLFFGGRRDPVPAKSADPAPGDRPAKAAVPGPPPGSRRWSWCVPFRRVRAGEDAWGAWSAYRAFGEWRARSWRIAFASLLFFVVAVVPFLAEEWPRRPTRGTLSAWTDVVVSLVAIGVAVALTWFVLDEALACRRFIRSLVLPRVGWDEATLERFSRTRGIDREGVGEWLDVQLVGARTEAVEKTVYGPFVLVLLLVLSQDGHFDAWAWPIPIVVGGLLVLLGAVVAAFLLRRSAEAARAKTIEVLETDAKRARLAGKPQEDRAERLERLVEEVRRDTTGSLGPFTDNPVLRAILIPFGGLGSWAILEGQIS